MTILFLTNNPPVSSPIFEWLKAIGEDVLFESEPIDIDFIESSNIEFVVSYNYIHIIREDVIDKLLHRIVNLHISFLPFNRGSDPNIWSFIEGTPSGVTIHEVDEGVDTGGILLQQQAFFDIDKETLRSSYNALHQMIQKLFRDNWDLLKSQKIELKLNGLGTTHTKKDAQFFAPILDYDDKVATFLEKVRKISR